tara:strand:+ start:1928 stop:2065 length:138 start_codon:yes stop_codon:yes gene_type:complete
MKSTASKSINCLKELPNNLITFKIYTLGNKFKFCIFVIVLKKNSA